MAYPASTKTLAELFAAADGKARQMKASANDFIAKASSGPIARVTIGQWMNWLDRAIEAWDEAAARGAPLATYAAEQKGVPVASEFAAMKQAALDLQASVQALYAATGSFTDLELVQPAEMTDLVAKLTALRDTIS